MEIVHGDVEIDVAAGGFNSENHGFGIGAATEALFAHVNFGWIDLEAKALVVEKGDAVADDHVGELADGFANHLLAFGQSGAGKLAGDAHGDVGSEIEDDTAFNVALDGDESGDTLAAIGVLVHGKVGDLGGSLQGFRKDGV